MKHLGCLKIKLIFNNYQYREIHKSIKPQVYPMGSNPTTRAYLTVYWKLIVAQISNSSCLDFSSSLVVGNNHSAWCNQILF